jgi:CspA family cold shock protein
MAEGRIKWFIEKKGYGFIETDETVDIFFHTSCVADHGHFGLQKQMAISVCKSKTSSRLTLKQPPGDHKQSM